MSGMLDGQPVWLFADVLKGSRVGPDGELEFWPPRPTAEDAGEAEGDDD